MGYTARWGPKGFLVSTNKVVPFEGLTTSFALKSDNNKDANGTSTANTRGMELQPISFSTHYHRAMGVIPLAQIEEWKSLVGASHPLYLNGKRFGPAKVKLKSDEVSDIKTDNAGNILSCAMSFSFEEDTSTSTTNATTSTSTSTTTAASSGTTAGKAKATYDAKVAEKKAAMTATASAEDKAEKNPARNNSGH